MISEPLALSRGIDQGCPLSGILFQLYNADLIDGYELRRGEVAVAFVDNALMLAWGKTLLDANSRLSNMMEQPGRGI